MTVRMWRDDDGDDTGGDRIVYAFGSTDDTAGRVAVDPVSGDVEILDLRDDVPPPGARFYLAAVIPRLHQHHDAGDFPASDTWNA